MAQNLQQEIDSTIASNKVVVYSKTWCGFCTSTKQLLNSKGVQYKLIELDTIGNGDAIQAALQSKTGQRTVPSIFINGQHIGGNSDLQAANSNGSLDAKLAA